MNVAFANNQIMVADETTSAMTITTDAVRLGNADRVAALVNVHAIWGPTTKDLDVMPQISNDGQHWADALGTADNFDATGDAQPCTTATAEGAYVRYKFTFGITGSGSGAVCFDLHARLFKV